MGLAPGNQNVSLIKENLIDIKEDGSFRRYTTSLTMTEQNERC